MPAYDPRQYLEELRLANASPRTLSTYRGWLARYEAFLRTTRVAPRRATRAHVIAFLKPLLDRLRAGTVKLATVELAASVLRAYYGWLVKVGVRTDRPTQELPIPRQREEANPIGEDEFLQPEEVDALLKHVKDYGDMRMYRVFYLLKRFVLRVGELVPYRADPASVEEKRHAIKILSKSSVQFTIKGERKLGPRTKTFVDVHPKEMAMLKAVLQEPPTVSAAEKALAKYVQRLIADLERRGQTKMAQSLRRKLPYMRPHMLGRHTPLSWLGQAGRIGEMDLKAVGGWSKKSREHLRYLHTDTKHASQVSKPVLSSL